MNNELDNLVSHFADIAFRLQGVRRYSVEPGKSGWEKTAPFPGIIFPLAGQSQYHFNGTPYLAKAGNIIHGGADMHLDKRVVGDRKWEFIVVLYDIRSVERRDIYLPDTHFELAVGKSMRLMELLRHLWNTYNRPDVLSSFKSETLFRRILEEAFVCAYNQKNDGPQTLFENVTSYIHEHYAEALTVRSLAEQYGVNENRLFYIFSKYAGMGAGDYLIALRLNHAKEMLVAGDAAIGEVAKSVGYHDPLYFSRIFNKHFGVSPSEMRCKFMNNP